MVGSQSQCVVTVSKPLSVNRAESSHMELGHPDRVRMAWFVGDSPCASVFVGVSVWTMRLWLGGLRAIVDNLLVFIDVHIRAGMLLHLQA